MMRRLLIILVMLAALGGWLFAIRHGSTPPFRGASGAVTPGSIASIEQITLGGVEQSLVIRGRSRTAPILIWLHGGPGTDEAALMRIHNAILEEHFLVVYWTQRGTGRSWRPGLSPAAMTLAQFTADLHALVGTLQARFGQRQVVLAGHSWGTNIGVAYAQAHPENVAAYVGIGQIANSAEGERRSYAFTLAEAKRRQDGEALTELTAMGPPPYSFATIIKQRVWLNAFGGAWHKPTSLFDLMRTSWRASEASWLDLALFMPGQEFSGNALAAEIASFDWLHTATRFEMPVFIVAGRHDRNTDADLAHEYFEQIQAPAKQFAWFEQSAHSPLFEEPERFNRFMIDAVLPVALRSGGRPRETLSSRP